MATEASEMPQCVSLSRDRLTADIWLWQRVKGHRFSADDVATAYVAAHAAPRAARILDLGCGIGSVLLHLAWTHREATLVGIEAQAISFELLARNVAESGYADRIAIHHGDLREVDPGRGFDLVTGTPPYFPVGTAVDALDEQRAYARVEYRGGVEAYVAAAARAVTADGVVVLCGDSDADERVLASAASVDLHVAERLRVYPRTGRPALFSIWTLRRGCREVVDASWTLRDAAGERTDDARRLRAFSGV